MSSIDANSSSIFWINSASDQLGSIFRELFTCLLSYNGARFVPLGTIVTPVSRRKTSFGTLASFLPSALLKVFAVRRK